MITNEQRAAIEQLATITRHYLIAALWSSTGDDDEPLDQTYTVRDFAPESVALATLTCEAFLKEHAALVEQALALYNQVDATPEAMFGHDLWLTRNGHGTGFWDRGLGGVGDQLTKASEALGEIHVYVGDDGKLHLEQ